MAIVPVNIGSAANDGTGDPLRTAFGKLNTSISELAPLASPALTGNPTAPTQSPGNDTTRIATTAFVKAAVDAIIAASDAMVFKGVIDCSGNPNYPAADRGATYRVSVAGKIGGGSGPNVEVGDILICLTDSTSSGNHATVGANWSIVQSNIDGAVVGPSSSTDNAAARFDSTTGKLLQNSALLIADTTGALSRSGGGGIPVEGTNTNDDASAGQVGEFLSAAVASTSAVSLTTLTATNVLSLALTAGDWDVAGSLGLTGGATTTLALFYGGISSTSATLPSNTYDRHESVHANSTVFGTGGGRIAYAVPRRRISLSGSATIYLVAYTSFAVSTCSAYGKIEARRVR